MAGYQISLMNIFIILSLSANAGNAKLLLLQTVSRHGDRAPIKLYPTDPNGIENWPNGLGKLTQLGKNEQYRLGIFLREMYKDFVTSDPNEVFANSSGDSRCLNSAESQLASFYAPTKEFRIAEDLHWQPIPINFLQPKEDIYLNVFSPCPRFEVEFKRKLNSGKVKEFYQTHQAAVANISYYAKENFHNPLTVYYLYNALKAEKIHNLTIPKWAIEYGNDMKTIFQYIVDAYNGSPSQIRLREGPFLGVITNNLIQKLNGHTPNLKVVVNVSHELNLSGVLRALKFNFPSSPYCATLLIELHEMLDATNTVRLLYMNSTDPSVNIEKPQVLVLDGCSEFCPVEQFIKTYEMLIPQNHTKECQLDPDSEY